MRRWIVYFNGSMDSSRWHSRVTAYGELNARIEAYYKQLEKQNMRDSHGMYALQGYSQLGRPPKHFYIKITSLEIVAKVVDPKIALRPPEEQRK